MFDFPSPKELRPPLIVLDDVVGRLCARTCRCCRGSICASIPTTGIALVGRNGNGKTTLARLLAGQLKPMGGTVAAERQVAGRLFRPASDRGARCRRDAVPAYGAAVAGGEARRGARQLGRFGFSGDKANLAVRQLSGGERAQAVARAHHARRAAYPDPRRADQPSRRRCARGAGRGVDRVRRRGGGGQSRPASARADRRPPRAGRWRHGEGIRRQSRRLSRHGARCERKSLRACA